MCWVSAFLWTAHGVTRDLYVYIVYSPGLAYGFDVRFSAEHGGRFDSGVPIRSAQEVCDRSDNTVVSGRVGVAVCKTARGARQSMVPVFVQFYLAPFSVTCFGFIDQVRKGLSCAVS